MNQATKPPVVFWVISVIALLWNLIGIGMFVLEFLITPEMMAEMTDAQRALREGSPEWLKIVHGVATISGLLGAIFLLMRNKLSLTLFLISLVAVLIQMVYSMIASNAVEGLDVNQAVVTPLLVIGIAVFLVYYARKASAHGWVKS